MSRLAVLGVTLAALGCADFDKLAQLKPRKLTLRINDLVTPKTGPAKQVPFPRAGLKPCLAWVDVALEQGWQKIEGQWVADGECVLRNVPPGETLLNAGQPTGPNWLTVTRDEVDFGEDFVGREFDWAGENTTVTLDLTGGAPLAMSNLFSMYLIDFGTGLLSSGVGNPGIGVPVGMTGATSFPVTFVWKQLPLVRADEGIEVFQALTLAPLDVTTTWSLVKRGTAKVQVVNGRNVRGSLAMSDVPQTASPGFGAFTFDPKDYYQAVQADLPGPLFFGTFFQQAAVVNGSHVGLAVQTTATFDKAVKADLAATRLEPFPGVAWSRRIVVSSFHESALGSLSDPPYGTLLLTNVFQGPADSLGWLTSGFMTPVRSITARQRDGKTVAVGELDSTTPVLRWDLPLTGLPNRFNVTPWEVSVDGAKLVFTKVPVRVYADRNEVHLPPEVLKPSTNYVFVVMAENCTAADPARPNRLNLQEVCAYSENRSLMMKTAAR